MRLSISFLTARVRDRARDFSRDRKGSAAIEFAVVAPLFLALLFAIIESALVFFAGQVLETAVQDSARKILTGQAQNANFSAAQFKTELCGRISALLDCPGGVSIDVQSYPSFSSVEITNPVDSGNNFVPPARYVPGGAGDIVVVRAFYQWQLYVTGLGYDISNLSGGKRLLSATTAFRNEPY
jgi:Flp pilus assembly protein TadG